MKKEANISSYRQILKSTSIVGGVQIFSLIINLLKTKFVALVLGATGVGLINLYTSTLNIVISIAGFGLNYSAVKEISESSNSIDPKAQGKVIQSFKIWLIFTAIFGSLITFVLAEKLSVWTFNDFNYTKSFRFLSIYVFCITISTGMNAILQGVRKLKRMAISTLIGSSIGFVLSIPIYLIYGVDGIVPTFLVSALFTASVSFYIVKRSKLNEKTYFPSEIFKNGIGLFKLGFLMSISTQIGTFFTYIINTYISKNGGIELLGFYSAGINLIVAYVGLVFAAMGTDYFPKLSSIGHDNFKIKILANQQIKMTLLIVQPIIFVLFITMPLIIKLLLSSEFLIIVPFTNLLVITIILKAVAFPIGYISFAKGDSMVYFIVEGLISNTLNLTLTLVFYKNWGILGIGFANIILYLIYSSLIYFVAKIRYNFIFERSVLLNIVFCLFLTISGYLTTYLETGFISYLIWTIIGLLSFGYSIYEFNRILDLSDLIRTVRKRIKL